MLDGWRLERDRRPTLWRPLVFGVSLVYVALALVEIVPGRPLPQWLVIVNGVLWGVLVVDYVGRVARSRDPGRYWRQPLCLLDIAILASFPVLLAFGTGVLGLACLGRVVYVLLRMQRSWREALRWLVPMALVGVILVISGYVWRAEELHPDSGIQSFSDALWWAVATILQVDYGDTYPHTVGGQLPAIVLTFMGVALFSWITAMLASWFVEGEERGARRDDWRRPRTLGEPAGLALTERLVRLEDCFRAGLLTPEEYHRQMDSLFASRRLTDLERLAALHGAGDLTDEEFGVLKGRIVGSREGMPT